VGGLSVGAFAVAGGVEMPLAIVSAAGDAIAAVGEKYAYVSLSYWCGESCA
jgi:hypothetical protein